MHVIEIDSLRPDPDHAAQFQGFQHGAGSSFYVVTSAPGGGVQKHRHPYDEIFVILKGNVEVIIDGEKKTLDSGIIVIPPNTWHEFKNRSDYNSLMVTIHSSPKMTQEDWQEGN
jgi:quercetin dioxygenase-like cupin family protein